MSPPTPSWNTVPSDADLVCIFQAIDVPVQRCSFAFVIKPLVIDGELRSAEHGLPIIVLVWVFLSIYKIPNSNSQQSRISTSGASSKSNLLPTFDLVTSVPSTPFSPD
ncbi:unnamed protein product [Macrosiphum euphorbiae]|uniref:Uncharacterized protein n=1 Tax=Macrosiphum euphorbiae TaxID=13131 RepID=A0AAV0VNQ9_9HEMI|nr:unnamed protein product [Macrosiphum euphorbiae]